MPSSSCYQLSLEIGRDGWCMAWVRELWGCFLNHPSAEEAIARAPGEIRRYRHWLAKHGESSPQAGRIRVLVTEVVQLRGRASRGMTGAFFEADREPVTREETAQALARLGFSRGELLALAGRLAKEVLAWKPARRESLVSTYYPTIEDQLRHIAAVERWYLQRLWPQLPELPRTRTPVERLAVVRRLVESTLRKMGRADRERVRDAGGEFWSARKVLRRLLYHEPYHIRQIERILAQARRA